MSKLYLDSYSIIGEESQTIHIVLNKNEKININKKYLLSASSQDLKENLYKNTDVLIAINSKKDINKDLKKVEDPQIVNLKNINSNFEYISLGKGGKIMKIMPSFYDNLYIKLDNLLAFNNGIELYSDKKLDDEIHKFFPNTDNIILRENFNLLNINANHLLLNKLNNQNQNKFCLIKTKLKNEIDEKNYENLASSFLFQKSNLINDMVFISGKRNLFEKRLGEGESFVILKKSLIGFEGSISFRQITSKDNNKYVNDLNDIVIDGPGLIIFEYNERIIPLINSKKYSIYALIFIILMFQLALHLLIFKKI